MIFKRKKRPDCDCEGCYWWKSERTDLKCQFASMLFCMAVFAAYVLVMVK